MNTQPFSQIGQMVKWLNLTKWSSVRLQTKVFMDWNLAPVPRRGRDLQSD